VEIVGVVGDVKYGAPDEPIGPDFYTSYLQFTYPSTMVLVKTGQGLATVLPALRRAVADVDSGLPIYDVQTLDDRIAQGLARPRYNAAMLALFAGAALLLAALGVYGVMAYSVSSRMYEIGIRVALGADPQRVLRLVLGEGARLAAIGAALGLTASLAFGRMLRTLLYGVAAADPAVAVTVILVIVAVALAAAFVPARRASMVDPMVVLRME